MKRLLLSLMTLGTFAGFLQAEPRSPLFPRHGRFVCEAVIESPRTHRTFTANVIGTFTGRGTLGGRPVELTLTGNDFVGGTRFNLPRQYINAHMETIDITGQNFTEKLTLRYFGPHDEKNLLRVETRNWDNFWVTFESCDVVCEFQYPY
jgi:hypothetical protein